MTTVGYGDVTPITIPGRTLAFLLCIWGVFLVSLMVLTLFETLKLSEEEKRALAVFDKLELRGEIKL
jgi:Ion channel